MLVLALLLASSASAFVNISSHGDPRDLVPDQYLVTFRTDASDEFRSFKRHKSGSLSKLRIYEFGDYMGFGATLTADELRHVQNLRGVASIEPNKRAHLTGVQTPASWHLDRVDQRALPLDNRYVWRDEAAGTGVGIYVLDSGILRTHADFGGRVEFLADCATPNPDWDAVCLTTPPAVQDGFGHGTTCAGVAASRTYGVAKNASIFDVRVFNERGSGFANGVIAGIEHVVKHAFDGVKIFSMSFNLGQSPALDSAVDAAFREGILTFTAAGNFDHPYCYDSPMTAETSVTVAASTPEDTKCYGLPLTVETSVTVAASTPQGTKASFSAYGPCVDIWAPGTDIVSTSNTGGTTTTLGTSLSTPQAAGAAALIASRGGITNPQAIRDAILGEALDGVLSGVPDGTVNKLLFTNP